MQTLPKAPTGLLLALLAAAGCADIDFIDAGVCGNHVTEGANDEDCDGEANCHAAGSPGECRFACQPDADCAVGCDPHSDCGGGEACCPTGFACGVDQVCRRASGNFAVAFRGVAAPTRGLALGDIDADHRADVVRLSTDTTSVHFYGDGLVPAGTTSLFGAASLPVPMDLTGDGLADLALRAFMANDFGGGMAVFRARPDRSLAGTTYSSIALSGISHARFVAIDALPPSAPEELLAFRDDSIEGILPGRSKQMLVDTALRSASELSGVAVGDFDEDPMGSPCEEAALAYRGEATVSVLHPCVGTDWQVPPELRPVALESGYQIFDFPPETSSSAAIGGAQALFGTDWNDDGHLDLLVVAAAASAPAEVVLLIAYGGGNGRFHSTLPLPAVLDDWDDRATVLHLTDAQGQPVATGMPLALGDFNGDRVPDIVTCSSILMSNIGDGSYSVRQGTTEWSAAVAGHFNNNSALDLVAARRGQPGLDFLDGTGQGVFSPSVLPSKLPVVHLATGDFDGDLLTDVVFAERATEPAEDGDVSDDRLFVSFGRPAGSPELPEEIGELRGIEQIIAGPIRGSDSAEEILMLASVDPESESPLYAAIVIGNGNRGLHAPFILRQMVQSAPNTEPVWIAPGSYLADGQVLAVMTQDQADAGGGDYRVWMVRPTYDDQAGLTPSIGAESAAVELKGEHTGLECHGCVPAAVDLDGDGLDELVTFDGTSLSVYEAVDDQIGGGFGLSSTHPSQVPFGSSAAATFSTRDILPRPVVRDIDLDGHDDVVLMAGTDVVVVWNDGAAGLADRWASGDPAVVTRIEHPAGSTISDFTLVNADSDLQLELVVLTSQGARLLQLEGPREFQPFQEGSSLAELTVPLQVLGGDFVAAGDLDGDGVDDLVIGDFDRYSVLRGLAVRP